MVTFHSVDSDGNKVIFSENFTRKDNRIIFNDKTRPNTQIELTINDDMSVLFERRGNINMCLPLSLGEKTIGHYKNSMGLEFEMVLITTKLIVNSNKITIEYDLVVEDVKQHHKLWILINWYLMLLIFNIKHLKNILFLSKI